LKVKQPFGLSVSWTAADGFAAALPLPFGFALFAGPVGLTNPTAANGLEPFAALATL
jgi:hypothetical protein